MVIKKSNKDLLLRLFCIVAGIFFLLSSCKTGDVSQPTSAEEAFDLGLKLFERKKYTESLSYFDMIKLQYPGSSYADKAQYYTAEINFIRKEYILSAFHYNRVRTSFPGSEFAQISLFKAGLSQFRLSPDYHKDQEYTNRAIKSLQEYQFYYPEKDSLYHEADRMILVCRNKLGEKEYMTAKLYQLMRFNRAALIYFESVLKNFDDTKYFEPAMFGKIEILAALKNFEEMENAERTYNNLFPDGTFRKQIETLNATR